MELDEFEIGQRRPGPQGEREPGPPAVRRVRGARPERGVAAGRQDRGARLVGLPAGPHARDPTVGVEQQRFHRALRAHAHQRVLDHARQQGLGHRTAGRAAPRVEDPPPTMPRFERQVGAARPAIERHARRDQLARHADAAARQHADRLDVVQPRAHRQGIGGVLLRAIVRREDRRDAALRPGARSREERPGGQQRHRGPALDGGQCRRQAGSAGPHDEQIGHDRYPPSISTDSRPVDQPTASLSAAGTQPMPVGPPCCQGSSRSQVPISGPWKR